MLTKETIESAIRELKRHSDCHYDREPQALARAIDALYAAVELLPVEVWIVEVTGMHGELSSRKLFTQERYAREVRVSAYERVEVRRGRCVRVDGRLYELREKDPLLDPALLDNDADALLRATARAKLTNDEAVALGLSAREEAK